MLFSIRNNSNLELSYEQAKKKSISLSLCICLPIESIKSNFKNNLGHLEQEVNECV